MSKSPLQAVNEKYGSKDKLVEELAGLVERGAEEEKAEVIKRLGGVSNAKLLRLRERMNRFAEFKSQKSTLLETVVNSAGRSKDAGFKARMETRTVGALLDIADRDERAQKRDKAKKFKAADKTPKVAKAPKAVAVKAVKVAAPGPKGPSKVGKAATKGGKAVRAARKA